MLRVPENKILALYSSIDLLLAPSSKLLRDAVPLKVIEAVAGRVPILAQSMPPLSALFHNSGIGNTVLVESESPYVWAERIKALLLDSNLRLRVADRAFEFLRSCLENHTEAAVAEVFLNSFENYKRENKGSA
jgi:glycosyltransferase involved in cell wall biosynthesis